MKPIGGYFELELRTAREMYADLLGVNSARNALVFLVKEKQIKIINLPYFNCSVVGEAIGRFCPETTINYYHVNEDFKPVDDTVNKNAPLYYVNYYGLQRKVIQDLQQYPLILDNAQAFYSKPIPTGDTIYCPRKFFGVSDGGYLHTSLTPEKSLEHDESWNHATHLLKRIDLGPTAGYADFQAADHSLSGRPLLGMSKLTRKILSSIDYDAAKLRRKVNFELLHLELAGSNKLTHLIDRVFVDNAYVPLCYPYMTRAAEVLRKQLIENRIFIPVYWPELKHSQDLNNCELAFVNDIVCLPVDQRNSEEEMHEILRVVHGINR